MARRQYFGDCTRNGRQGISPGWVDIYAADLDGQTLRLPAGANGRFCLKLSADPLELLMETDETDNATAVAIRTRDDDVRRLSSNACS